MMLFEIIFLIATLIIFILWLLSILWGVTNNGLEQIGRDWRWMKIYLYAFLALSFLIGSQVLTGFGGKWYSGFIKEVESLTAAFFIIITGVLALVGGGNIIFQGKQNTALFTEYRNALLDTAGILKTFSVESESSEEFKKSIAELSERIRILEACRAGDPYASARLEKLFDTRVNRKSG